MKPETHPLKHLRSAFVDSIKDDIMHNVNEAWEEIINDFSKGIETYISGDETGSAFHIWDGQSEFDVCSISFKKVIAQTLWFIKDEDEPNEEIDAIVKDLNELIIKLNELKK